MILKKSKDISKVILVSDYNTLHVKTFPIHSKGEL